MWSRAAVLLAAGLLAAPAAQGAIWIANDAKRPRLAVDARGFARVSWVQGGVKRAVIVPPRGQLTHGGAPKADGTFAVFLRPEWTGRRYRVTVPGPNAGSTYAPDVQIAVP